MRTCKTKRGPKKTRTEGEEQSSNRFTEVRKMWRVYRRAIGGLPIWSVWARQTGAPKSDTLFHSVNGSCFRPGEGVWAFPTFRFSMGTLDAPVITCTERNGWTVTLRWENDVDCPKANARYPVPRNSSPASMHTGAMARLPSKFPRQNNRMELPYIYIYFSVMKTRIVSHRVNTWEFDTTKIKQEINKIEQTQVNIYKDISI